MKYKYSSGVIRERKAHPWLWTVAIILATASYLAINFMAPRFPAGLGASQAVADTLTNQRPAVNRDRLYIPQIGLDVAIIKAGEDASAAIQQNPDAGNPEQGGSYELAASNFELGWTPQGTRSKSPFYQLSSLKPGDQFFVDYNGQRYAYQVQESTAGLADKDVIKLSVLESVSDSHITATPVGTVAWVNGKPQLKALGS